MTKTADAPDIVALDELGSALRAFVAGALERAQLAEADGAAIAAIYHLADQASRASSAAWIEHRRRVERETSNPRPPEPVESLYNDVRTFLGRSEEIASIGSAQVQPIRFPEGRAAVATAGERLIQQVEKCIQLGREREARDNAWRHQRVAFVDELYTRPETAALLRAFDELEALLGADFEAERGHGAPRSSLIRALQSVIPWCDRKGKPFLFPHLPIEQQAPLHDFRAMRQEWKAKRH